MDVDFVKNSDADEVIVATGAKHIIPNIPGIDKPMVMTAVDLLEGKKTQAIEWSSLEQYDRL